MVREVGAFQGGGIDRRQIPQSPHGDGPIPVEPVGDGSAPGALLEMSGEPALGPPQRRNHLYEQPHQPWRWSAAAPAAATHGPGHVR